MNFGEITAMAIGQRAVNSVYYGSLKIWPEDQYIKKYFYVELLSQGNLYIELIGSMSDISVEISTNLTNWTTYNLSTSGYSILTFSGTQGIKYYFRGTNSYYASSSSNYFHIRTDVNCNVGGNIMSLIYGSNFANQKTLTSNNTFVNFFKNLTTLIDASNLRMPATTITRYCYQNMFYGCTNLIGVPPVLPASYSEYYSYSGMFQLCKSLNSVPDLSSLTRANGYAFANMFSNCTSLTKLPVFKNVNRIDYWAPWRYTFSGCTSLVNAYEDVEGNPLLPTSLTVTSGGSAYEHMFNGCTSLTGAPDLTEVNPHQGEFNNMFYGCTSLYHIVIYAKSLGTNYFSSIVKNTGHEGIIYNASGVTWDASGYSQFKYDNTNRWEIR